MHDALRVRKHEAVGDVFRDRECPFERKGAACLLEQAFNITAAEQFGDDVGRTALLAHLEDRDDVRVRAHAAHRLRLTRDALAARGVEAIRLDERKGHVAIEGLIVREEDFLFAAFTEEATHVVPACNERLGVCRRGGCRRGRGGGSRRRRRGCGRAEVGLGGPEQRGGVLVVWVHRKYCPGLLGDRRPVTRGHGGFRLVQEGVNTSLYAFAWHCGGLYSKSRWTVSAGEMLWRWRSVRPRLATG